MLSTESCLDSWKRNLLQENAIFTSGKSKKYPYQLGLSSLSLNVMSRAAIEMSNKHSDSFLKIKISMFDLDLMAFFGNTFTSSGN